MGTAVSKRPGERSTPAPSKDEKAQAPWWRGAVIYQVYPRSFRDTTGDGVGDLRGILDGLPHIASLGVDAVWLSPFFTSPMADYGYDVADYTDIDPIFGTLDDFDAIISRAHELGLKVIIDQVYSHTSDKHAWFEESRQCRGNSKADWYVWADAKPDGSPPSNWQSVFGGPAWEWDARRKQYYLHNFLKEQPQLNVHNREVQDALLRVAKFWLDRGVDGFRLDAINFAMHNRALTDNPPAHRPMGEVTRPFDMQLHVHNQSQPEIPKFLERIRALLDRYDAQFTVAEVGGPDPLTEMKAFTTGETRLNSAYSFDFLYADDISPARVRAALASWPGNDGEGWPSWAFSNHDAPRAVSRWAGGHDIGQVSKCLMLLLLSLRGNAFIYQGEELGLPQANVPFDRLLDPEAITNWPLTLGRDGARTPMPWTAGAPTAGFSTAVRTWLPFDVAHDRLSVDVQEMDARSVLAATRALISTRSSSPALRSGDIRFLDTPEPILAFWRTVSDERVLCVFNLGDTPMNWTPVESEGWSLVATEAGVQPGSALPTSLQPFAGYWAKAVAGA